MADIEYSINGVNLARASANTLGAFILRNGTTALGGITNTITKITVPNYDGYFQAPKTRTEQVLIFNIRVPRENLEALLAVLSDTGLSTYQPRMGVLTVSSATNKAAYFELVSAIPDSSFPNDSQVTVTATLNIPQGAWRDTNTTTSTFSITTTPQTISVASGISLPISDADIFLAGNAGTWQLTDSNGSWLRTTSSYVFASGYGLYYQGSTGRAYKATTAAPFTAVDDLGFAVDVSSGGFKISPTWTTDPRTRSGSVTVTTLTQTSTSVQIRWRGAYTLK